MPGMIHHLPLMFLLVATLFLAGCASDVEYAPKDKVQAEEDAQEHRVYYEGWGRRRPSREERPSLPSPGQGLN